MRQLGQLISVHFKEFFREPGVLFWTLAFPVLMAWGLGIAFTQKGDTIHHVALLEGSKRNQQIEQFLEKCTKEKDLYKIRPGNKKLGNTIFFLHPTNMDRAILMLKRGEGSLIIDANRDSLHYLFDPKNSEAQLAYMQLASAIEGKDVSGEMQTIQPLHETGTRYVDFLVPGLLAMGIMMSAMWGISYSLIEKRSKKLLRRMVATPMRKTNFLLSYLVSRILLSVVESALLLAFAWWYFRIDIQGSIPALILIFLAGNLAFVGLAIFVSSRTANTQVGNGWINLVVMPMMIGSGIFFSYHNFPDWLVPVIRYLPLTLLADGVRSIFIEGAGLLQVWKEIVILAIGGTVFFYAGLRIYKWY